MIHNPNRIRLIERWSGWLAWFSLISGMTILVATIFGLVSGQIYSSPYHVDFTIRLLRKSDSIIGVLQPLISTIAMFLMLQGVSIATRFLRNYYAQITAGT